MPAMNYYDGKSILEAPGSTRRGVGRGGGAPALDRYIAIALDDLEKQLDKGLPPQAEGNRAERKRILSLPIHSGDANDETLFTVIDAAVAAAAGGGVAQPIALDSLIDKQKLTDEYLAVKEFLASRWGQLDPNAQAILGRTRILEYLFLRARWVEGLENADGIFRNLASGNGGLRVIHKYAVVRSFYSYRKDAAIQLPAGAADSIIERLLKPPVSLSQREFLPKVRQLVQEYVHGADKLAIINAVKAQLGIKDEEVPALVQYLNGAPYINAGNALHYLAAILVTMRGADAPAATGPQDGELASQDFSVDYYDEQTTALQFDKTSVEAAAQLFYVMVWGDELGVFEVLDRIAAQRDPHLKLSIRKRETADDLSMYVFDEQFRNLKTGKTCRRVDRDERQMYYRQVFGAGRAPVADGMDVNADFPTLWGVLMNEVKTYIVRTEAKQGQVSRQRVYQAIEDLQYNLSAACSGMTKVAAPIVYREMDFVIRRLLGSDDVTSQLSKDGPPSFMKVIENVRGVRGLNPLRNKGMIGHQIISMIASATPALLEDTKQFDGFIQAVEAYIVTLGQMGDSLERGAEPEEDDRAMPGAMPPGAMAPGAMAPGSEAGGQEWSF